MAGYHVENFGCRASQADGDAIASEMERLGLPPAATGQPVSVVVVNTCTVTAEADRDARAYIRRAQRLHPGARVLVTGCYAQRAPQEIADLPGVAGVFGNSHKHLVAAEAAGGTHVGGNFIPLTAIGAAEKGALFSVAGGITPGHLHAPVFAHTDFNALEGAAAVHASWSGAAQSTALLDHKSGRTRPSLKIQDGCGNRCTFCVIPTTRGDSRSLPRQHVLEAVRRFADSGGMELVLSGINLGRWGRDLETADGFAELVAAILDSTALPRLRISSVEPMDWSEALIALLRQYGKGEHPRLARHAHLPLQSGSDAVLRRMHRRYRPWHYAAKVAAITAAQPQAAIGADVMVGFPGETDAEFQESYDFIAAQPFTYLHLFPFSARPGTAAWELHRQHPVAAAAVQARMAALRALIDEKNRAFRQSFVDLGMPLSVVTLETGAAQRALGQTEALSDNFIPVQIEGIFPANQLLSVAPGGLTATGLMAHVDNPTLRFAEIGRAENVILGI